MGRSLGSACLGGRFKGEERMKPDRTEALARDKGYRWAARASKAELAAIRRLAAGELITFGRLRRVIDPLDELLACEMHLGSTFCSGSGLVGIDGILVHNVIPREEFARGITPKSVIRALENLRRDVIPIYRRVFLP
jgi:hypothetical protein